MVRVLACAVALLSLGSAVRAERINIVGVVANYVTARDAVDIEIWLDRPLDMQRETLLFAGGDGALGNSIPGIVFTIKNGSLQTPTDYFSLNTRRATSHPLGQVWVESTTRPVEHESAEAIRDGELRYVVGFTFTADTLRLDDMLLERPNEFRFTSTVTYTDDRGYIADDYVSGIATVNSPELIHSPEPSSLVLLGLAHLIWLPGVRKRFRERRVREANRIGG